MGPGLPGVSARSSHLSCSASQGSAEELTATDGWERAVIDGWDSSPESSGWLTRPCFLCSLSCRRLYSGERNSRRWTPPPPFHASHK